jgi:restriction endonuclease-like protein
MRTGGDLTASMLRRELSARSHDMARAQRLLHDVSPGANPVVIFGRDEQGRHGNFHPESYTRICANPAWGRRLTKVHTASRRSRARKDWQWMELDSANSSDALLMNIFCHPGVFSDGSLNPRVANLLNVDADAQPCFGIRPGVPLRNGHLDRTEIDLHLGNLFIEAKLTESSFQNARPRLIERYRDLETVFDITRLPWTGDGIVQGYQLIRNVLAAFAGDTSFCVLSDARRRDLIEVWYAVLSAVHYPSFAWRLKLLTWQEMDAALPTDLQQFLDIKYGITPA